MPYIGVDLSGQVGDPPVYTVGVKLMRRDGQHHKVVCLSKDAHDGYRECTRNWVEKVSAILIYKATVELFGQNDVIIVDKDFLGWRQEYVNRCIKRLFGTRFYGNYPLSDPNIMFVPARENHNVKEAHIKSRLARFKGISLDIRDPNLDTELDWLERL